MINRLHELVKELEIRAVINHFEDLTVTVNEFENDTETITIESVPYSIDNKDNVITELDKYLSLDNRFKFEVDTIRKLIIIKEVIVY